MKRTVATKMSPFYASHLPVRLHLRNDLHLARKAWHMFMGLVIAFLYLSGVSAASGVVILACFLGFDLIVETARLRIPAFNERVMRIWGPFMRASEADRLSGIPFYLLSTMLAIAIFPKPVAILCVLYLACGDPIASLFGILYGKGGIRLAPRKSLVGTLAGVVTCSLVTFIYLKTLPVSPPALYGLTLIGGLAGGTAELMPVDMDDNFTIPVISGFIVWLGFIVFGI